MAFAQLLANAVLLGCLVLVLPKGSICLSGPGQCAGSVNLVPQQRLFTSEPPPELFGNPENPSPGMRESHNWSQKNWLKSRFHFSFAEYGHGPNNFGVLRVMNDDLVQPLRGFGPHPHRDMAILTFVVDGFLTHKDSTGAEETLGRGSIQFMTAGTGVVHSEHNLDEQPLRFIQCWILPRVRGAPPTYGSLPGDATSGRQRLNGWFHAVGDDLKGGEYPVKINQDCNMYISELTPGTAVPRYLNAGRQGYLLCVEGEVHLNAGGSDNYVMQRHDAAELKGPLLLEATGGTDGALVLLFEMELTEDSRGEL
mmetsp:Transcript_8915/g.21151  ORF Transcript_8915/g.21151 Transcript_8915/m.21151 type:complete len:310 (+) Transcript_8915:27-956(+)